MANPLSGHKHRHLDMKSQDYLFKGRGVLVAQQIVDQGGILADGFRAFAVGYPSGLHNAVVTAQIVDQAHKTLLVNLEFLVQQGVRRRYYAMRHKIPSLNHYCTGKPVKSP